MSRVGKVPITIPDKVDVTISDRKVIVKGQRGELQCFFTELVDVEKKGNTIVITPQNDTKLSRSLWGTTRALIKNMVLGVSSGISRDLEFNGVGYKAEVKGDVIILNLGYSHPIEYPLPKGIKVKVTKNSINIEGCDKELVGFVAAKIRSFRPPEPYKGKGIKYADERIKRKAGKTSVKA